MQDSCDLAYLGKISNQNRIFSGKLSFKLKTYISTVRQNAQKELGNIFWQNEISVQPTVNFEATHLHCRHIGKLYKLFHISSPFKFSFYFGEVLLSLHISLCL